MALTLHHEIHLNPSFSCVDQQFEPSLNAASDVRSHGNVQSCTYSWSLLGFHQLFSTLAVPAIDKASKSPCTEHDVKISVAAFLVWQHTGPLKNSAKLSRQQIIKMLASRRIAFNITRKRARECQPDITNVDQSSLTMTPDSKSTTSSYTS